MIRKLIVIRGVLELQSKLFRTDSLINTNATHQIIMVLQVGYGFPIVSIYMYQTLKSITQILKKIYIVIKFSIVGLLYLKLFCIQL